MKYLFSISNKNKALHEEYIQIFYTFSLPLPVGATHPAPTSIPGRESGKQGEEVKT